MSIGRPGEARIGWASDPLWWRTPYRLSSAWRIALVVFVAAFASLAITHRPTHLALPRDAAVHDLYADPGARQALRAGRVTRIDVLTFDQTFDHVDAYHGSRLVFTTDIARNGAVVASADLRSSSPAFGSDIANSPWVIGLLAATFVLMTAVWPLVRVENLDVALTLGFVGSVLLYNHPHPVPFMLVSYPTLAALAIRCAIRALAPARAHASVTPLFDHLTARLGADAQRRILQLTAVAAGLIVAMVGLSSLHVVDVGYAVMEGATLLTHGTLPYHHIPDVLHGDTYPLASYLLYVPFAALTPVRDTWADADATLAVAVIAAIATAVVVGRWRSGAPESSPAPRAESAGLRAAIAWLTFPTVLITVSTGTTDVVLALVLLFALAAWRRPTIATAILALGAWFKLVPLALAPLAFARLRGSGWWRSALVLVGISAPLLAVLLLFGGLHGLRDMLIAIGFQGSRTSSFTPWRLTGTVPLQQLVQAAVLALIVGAAVQLRRDRGLANDRTRLAALFSAVLLGLQLAASYWSFLYLVWVLPLVALMLCRPGEPRLLPRR